MKIVLQQGEFSPQVSVTACDDMKRLALEVAADVHPFEIALARGVTDIDESGTHVWFAVEELRDLAEVDRQGRSIEFDQMIAKAAEYGWVADGSVRAHITRTGHDDPEFVHAPAHPAESHLKGVFRTMPSGVIALAGKPAQGPAVAMTVSSFTNVSMQPALLGVCIRRESQTWPELVNSPRIGVSLLSSSQGSIALELSAPDQLRPRLAHINHVTSQSGAVYIRDAVSWYQTRLFEIHSGGDHLIALLDIERCAKSVDAEPVVYYDSGFRAINGS